MAHTRGMIRASAQRSPWILASALVVTAVAACTPTGPEAGEATTTAAQASTGSGTVATHATRIDGIERTWTSYTPAGVDAATAPVMILLHGTGDTGSGFRSGIGPDFEKLADERGFTLAYPDGYRNNWNECRRDGDWPAKERDLDDVGLMREIVHTLGTSEPVYAVGFSSGGHMAMRLALEAPDLVASVAVVAANPPTADNQGCDVGSRSVQIMFVEGREDPINPIDGGEVVVGRGLSAVSRGDVVSAAAGAEWFAERNGAVAGSGPSTVRDGAVETTTWKGAHPARLVVLDHVGHSFPTLSGRWGQEGGARYDAPGQIVSYLAGS